MSFLQYLHASNPVTLVCSPNTPSETLSRIEMQTGTLKSSQTKNTSTILSKTQIAVISQKKQMETDTSYSSRKARISAFEFYTKAWDENPETPQTPTPKLTFPGPKLEFANNQKTRNLVNNGVNKNPSPGKKPAKSLSKVKESINNSNIIKSPQRSMVFERPRKNSLTGQNPEYKTIRQQSNYQQNPQNSRLFKPAQIQPFLAQQFRKILQGRQSLQYQSQHPKQPDQMFQNKKQLQITNLKHKLSQLQKQKNDQKHSWIQQQRIFNKRINQLQRYINQLKKQNIFLMSSQYRQQQIYKLQQKIIQNQNIIKGLQQKNKLLNESFCLVQDVLNQSIFTYSTSSTSLQSNPLEIQNQSLCQSCLLLLQNKNIQKSYQQQNSILQQQFLKMLLLKNQMNQKQISKSGNCLQKLRSIAKILEDHNHNIIKHSLRRLSQSFIKQNI